MPFTPYDAGRHGIRRAEFLLAGSVRATQVPTFVRTDMRKLSVVMAVSALDTYMHRLVVARAYKHDKIPPALAKLSVSFARLLEQADEAGRAARAQPRKARPRVGIKRQLRDRLLLVTFQKSEEVSTALAMAGRKKAWEAIGQSFDPPIKPADAQARLDTIVTRRNQIVHEGDYRRLDKPRGPAQNAMTFAEAEADIRFLSDLIEAIHSVA